MPTRGIPPIARRSTPPSRRTDSQSDLVSGLLAGDSLNDVSSNGTGEYTLKLNVDGPQTVVVAFRMDGYAPLYRTIDVAPGADIPLSVTLREMSCT